MKDNEKKERHREIERQRERERERERGLDPLRRGCSALPACVAFAFLAFGALHLPCCSPPLACLAFAVLAFGALLLRSAWPLPVGWVRCTSGLCGCVVPLVRVAFVFLALLLSASSLWGLCLCGSGVLHLWPVWPLPLRLWCSALLACEAFACVAVVLCISRQCGLRACSFDALHLGPVWPLPAWLWCPASLACVASAFVDLVLCTSGLCCLCLLAVVLCAPCLGSLCLGGSDPLHLWRVRSLPVWFWCSAPLACVVPVLVFLVLCTSGLRGLCLCGSGA